MGIKQKKEFDLLAVHPVAFVCAKLSPGFLLLLHTSDLPVSSASRVILVILFQ